MNISERLRRGSTVDVQPQPELMVESADYIDEAHKLLRDCEWANQTPTDRACPVCFHSVTKGHTDTCRLKLFLEGHQNSANRVKEKMGDK